MSAKTPEGKITAQILDWLNQQPNTVAHKVAAGPYQQRGEPDIDCVSMGRAVKLEVKRPGTEAAITKAVTPLQRERLRAYADAGAVVGVVTSLEEAQTLYVEAQFGCAQGDALRPRWASVRSQS